MIAGDLVTFRATGPAAFDDVRLTVVDTATGQAVGTAGLTGGSPEHRHALAYVRIDPAHAGRGYRADALRALCRWAFDTVNLAKVEAEVDAADEETLRLHEDLGFVREVHRRTALWVDGAWHDEYLLGLLAGELR